MWYVLSSLKKEDFTQNAENDYDLPVERVNNRVSRTYTEPLFDGEPEAEISSDGYQVPQNHIIASQHYANECGRRRHHSQTFVQPPACLISLLAQIRETMTMEISSESIRYVFGMYVCRNVCYMML